MAPRIKAPGSPLPAPPAAKRAEEAKLIEHMLSSVEDDLEGRRRKNAFIESLREQFDRSGWLTPNQLEALRKFYANV
jgi:NADH:ubiquinone oxidoreductase subunit E